MGCLEGCLRLEKLAISQEGVVETTRTRRVPRKKIASLCLVVGKDIRVEQILDFIGKQLVGSFKDIK